MGHTRNDARAVNRRRRNALTRWMANRDAGYRYIPHYHYDKGVSDGAFVNNQISILEERVPLVEE